MKPSYSALAGIFVFPLLLTAAPPLPQAGYKWVRNEMFSDEFNGTALDQSKWFDHHPRWKGRPPAKFVPGAISVAGGFLRIRNGLLPAPDGAFTLAGGAVVSRSTGAFYGYYETRMKASKIAMSSTFWMSNEGEKSSDATAAQEIDIVETIGAPPPQPDWAKTWNRFMNSNTHAFHTRQGKKEDLKTPGRAPLDPPAGDAFHIYAAWWVDANTVKFYLDDQYVFTLHPSTKYSPAPFARPMHVNLVTETYDWAAPPTAAEVTDESRNTTYYDWVHAFTLVPDAPPTTSPR
jgi:hypothetical protein